MSDVDQRWLEVVFRTPEFVFRETGTRNWVLVRLDTIPRNSGRYLVAGVAELKDGTTLSSVFRIDSAGDTPVVAYWKLNEEWVQSTDPKASEQIGKAMDELTGFVATLNVPLATA